MHLKYYLNELKLQESKMKKIFIGLLALGPFSAFASPECWLNNKEGSHIDFDQNKELFDSGEPFGLVKVKEIKKGYSLTYTINGEETVVEFKKKLSLTKQPVKTGGLIGNIVCH
jgi:hypothetical protein